MKKKRFLPLLFLIAPLLLVSFHVYFMQTVDSYKRAVNIDPDYAYLLSSIDISSLQKSRMVLHPGTTLQVMSNLIMRTAHLFSDNSGDDLRTAVLKNPVFYLTVLNAAFASMNIILVFLLGIFTYFITKKILVGLLIQFTPFLSSQTLIFGVRKVTADIVLIFISLLLALILVKIVHSNPGENKRKIYVYALILGLICGFGAATKITFIMLWAIPLIILPAIIPRIVYVCSAIAGGFFFTLPISSMYNNAYKFLQKISTHSGTYGHGEKSIINFGEFAANLWRIVLENIPFFIIFLTALVIIFFTFLSTEKRESALKDMRFKLLLAVTASQIIGMIIVARHFKSKYLLPVFCLTGLLLYLIYINSAWIFRSRTCAGQTGKRYSRWLYPAAFFFLLFSMLFSLSGAFKYHSLRLGKLKECIAIQNKIKSDFKGYAVVYYYNAPAVIFGLEFGNRWTPLYAEKLKKIYGDRYFYHRNRGNIYNWNPRDKISFADLKKKYNGKILFMGMPFHKFRGNVIMPAFPLKDVFAGAQLTIYQVVDE